MIRHCVWVKFRSDVPEAERQGIYADLVALKDSIGGIVSVSFGGNVSPEGLGRGYADGFVMDFVDAAARDAYLPHPVHQKAAGRLVAATEGGVDGVLVFDLVV